MDIVSLAYLYQIYHKIWPSTTIVEPICAYLENTGYIKIGEGEVELRDKALRILRDEVEVEEVGDTQFKELYLLYPTGYASRKFRTVEAKGSLYDTLKKAYLKKIRTLEDHKKVITGLKREIASRTTTGELKYMQLLSTYINQQSWELWQATEAKIQNILDEDL